MSNRWGIIITKMVKRKPKNKLWREVIKGSVIQYLVTGIVVFYSDYLVFWVAYSLKNWSIVQAQAVAYVVGVVTNFLLERYWVFKHQTKNEPVRKETGRYVVILIVNYFLTVAILELLESFGISPLWGKYAAAFFFTFWNYVVFRFWVFKGNPQKRKKHR